MTPRGDGGGMAREVWLEHLDAEGLRWAQDMVTRHHYRRTPVPARAFPEAWAVRADGLGRLGCLLVARPHATAHYPHWGSLEAVASGRAQCSYWCVLNLARVWLSPSVQPGGICHGPSWRLPGYVDRRGTWRSTLASAALGLLERCVGAEYLLHRPPCFVEEPYALRWLSSYSDPQHHKGTIYRAAGFEHFATNDEGKLLWRLPLPDLTEAEDAAIREASRLNERARRFRARRASTQLALPLAV